MFSMLLEKIFTTFRREFKFDNKFQLIAYVFGKHFNWVFPGHGVDMQCSGCALPLLCVVT